MIEPKTIQKIDSKIAERAADREKRALLDSLENGISLLSTLKPQERLRGYMGQTYEFDVPMLLDSTYPDQRRSGQYEPLFAEKMRVAWTEQLMMRQRALEVGVDPNVIPQEPEPKLFWAKFFDFPFGIDLFEKAARDFRNLYNQRVLKPRAERVGVAE